tara:strand:+ start:176 stop:415 length:240 start_codon:yes stop_codon:yes gene_type:complete
MATLLKSDGSEIEWTDITLSGMQKAVDGYIELVHLPKGKMLVVNEDGLRLKLPYNPKASQISQRNLVGDILLMNQNEID